MSHNVVTTDTNAVLCSRSIYCWEDCSRLTVAPGLAVTFMHTAASFSRTQCVADATDDVVRKEGRGKEGGRRRLSIQSQLLPHYNQPRCKSNYFSISPLLASCNIFSLFNRLFLHCITHLRTKSSTCSHMLYVMFTVNSDYFPKQH